MNEFLLPKSKSNARSMLVSDCSSCSNSADGRQIILSALIPTQASGNGTLQESCVYWKMTGGGECPRCAPACVWCTPFIQFPLSMSPCCCADGTEIAFREWGTFVGMLWDLAECKNVWLFRASHSTRRWLRWRPSDSSDICACLSGERGGEEHSFSIASWSGGQRRHGPSLPPPDWPSRSVAGDGEKELVHSVVAK